MKVFILYSTTDKPYGGANQFMRALSQYLERNGFLTRNIFAADIVLFNSHLVGGPFGRAAPYVYGLRKLFPRKIFVHRVDGPMQLYGGESRKAADEEVHRLNRDIADATVYQSEWSRDQNASLGMVKNSYEEVICNASDPKFFYAPDTFQKRGLVRLMASAWSDHPNKGIDVYRRMDTELDWSKYEMTFVGRVKDSFKNITVLDPVASNVLGDLLRSHDIFISASRNDACSNSVIEALSCGLPVVARRSGGHPELVKSGGELFDTFDEAILAIDRIAGDLSRYRKEIVAESMDFAGEQYVQFFKKIVDDVGGGLYQPKRMSFFT